jgi:hypothetical protein
MRNHNQRQRLSECSCSEDKGELRRNQIQAGTQSVLCGKRRLWYGLREFQIDYKQNRELTGAPACMNTDAKTNQGRDEGLTQEK